MPGVGTEVAAQKLITAGDNSDRLRWEAAFAHLCGVAPVPASSGRTRRHRLNRGGDLGANNALYIVVIGRLRYDSRTRAYAARRTTEGLSGPEIIRCLKRFVAREIFTVLTARTANAQSRRATALSTAALTMTTGAARCIYALRPADRPGCQLTANVTYGGIGLCSACESQRSSLGKGQTRHRLPDTEPDPIALVVDARLHLIDAQEQPQAAVIRARQHHTTWTDIASVLSTTRQAAQQRFTPALTSIEGFLAASLGRRGGGKMGVWPSGTPFLL
jgi:Transposase IS116/IS110/IS902 family